MKAPFSGVLDLKRSRGAPLHRQLYDGLRAAILDGRLRPGSAIPASRVLARDLALSRTTVLAAIEQLVVEGYVETRRGSGTRVAHWTKDMVSPGSRPRASSRPISRDRLVADRWRDAAAHGRPADRNSVPKPLRSGIPDVSIFPTALWTRLLRRTSLRIDGREAGYAFTSGHPAFKQAITRHLVEHRLARIAPEQVIVTPSAQGALDLIARLLLEPGDRVWIEDPGYRGARIAFLLAGAKLIPVPVDSQGIDPAALRRSAPPKLIYVTPSHQYPLGHTLSLARRLELLDLAEAAGAIIVEDDYDSDFQYEGRPIAALQGFRENTRVIYVGTLSKTMMPALRLGYLAAPPALTQAFAQLQRNTGHGVAVALQLAIAAFIEEGHYRAHIRRMEKLYRERRDALLSGLADRLAHVLTPLHPQGGMQLAALLKRPESDRELARRLDAAGVEVEPLSAFHLERARYRGLLMGFAAWTPQQIETAVRRMADVLGA